MPIVENISNEQEYLKRIESRIDELENRSSILSERIKEKDVNIERIRKLFKEENRLIDSDIEELNKEFNSIVNNIINMINRFRTACRKSDLEIVKRKAELWAPENKITKNQFMVMLEKKLKLENRLKDE